MISYQLTSAAIAAIIALKIFFLIRRNVLHTRYATWWIIVATLVMIAGVFPKLIDQVALKLGVNYPPILVIVSGVGLILVKMLTMDLDRSKQEQNIRRLTQKLAIMEEEANISKKQPKKPAQEE